MNVPRWSRRMTIFPKLIAAFLIAIMPIVLTSLQMNRMGAKSVKTELLASMQARVHANMKSLEVEMERIIRLHQQYLLDNDLNKLSMMSSILPYYEVYLMQMRVRNKLWVMKNSNLYVKEAKAYIPMIGKTLLSLSDEEGMSPDETTALQALRRNQLSPVVYWKNKLLINSIYPDPSQLDTSPIYILQAEIDQKALQAFLVQGIPGTAGSGSLLFTSGQEWMITDRSDDQSQTLAQSIRSFVRERSALNDNSGQEKATIAGKNYYITFEHSELLSMDMVIYNPEEQVLGSLNQYRGWLWLLFGLSIAVIFGFSYWIFRLIHSPLRIMVRAFRKVEGGDLELELQHRNEDEFQYLYGQFNRMVRQLQYSVQEVYTSRITAQQAELKQLQSQINPHFLYNTYFMVHRMAEAYDVDNVVKATAYLGTYFQYITRNAQEEATLAEEWKHMIAYVELQQMRFSKRIRTEVVEGSNQAQVVRLPRLILQPLVENAYQHGLQSTKAGGLIRIIALDLPDGDVMVRIEDSGSDLTDATLEMLIGKLAKKPDAHTERTGLLNVHLRLQLKQGAAGGLRLSRSALGGLQIEFVLASDRQKLIEGGVST